VAGFPGHRNEHSGLTKGGEFLGQLSDYRYSRITLLHEVNLVRNFTLLISQPLYAILSLFNIWPAGKEEAVGGSI
jgi:hypothetical protein